MHGSRKTDDRRAATQLLHCPPQNLVDSLTVAVDTPPHNRLSEVAICFGGKLLRGNRAQKVGWQPWHSLCARPKWYGRCGC